MINIVNQLGDVLNKTQALDDQNKMSFSSSMLIAFLEKLMTLDREFKDIIKSSGNKVEARAQEEKAEWSGKKLSLDSKILAFSMKKSSMLEDTELEIKRILEQDVIDKKSSFYRLLKCKESLALINSVEKSIMSKTAYENTAKSHQSFSSMTIDGILSGMEDFIRLAHIVNTAIRDGRRREFLSKSSQLYGMCRRAEKLLNDEISKLRSAIVANKDDIHGDYDRVERELTELFESEWSNFMLSLDTMAHDFSATRDNSKAKTKITLEAILNTKRGEIESKSQEFCEAFPPAELSEEYARIYSLEPSFDNYTCVKEMPRDIYVGTFEYDVASWRLCDITKEFLNKYYYFMFRGTKLIIPHCVQFKSEFNYMFRFDGEGKNFVVRNACEMGMRLFMMMPPGKVNFTFIDPVTLGESFAMFTRLVDVDDRTSEIINGKIWSSPSDIEAKLKIMTDHISNVTQRCLQGKYDNIFEYNKVAEQNAEAYQILMLMDFPAGLTDQSLRLLEQIVTSGPKCGVFTLIYRNEAQYEKISERSYPLVGNIEACFKMFNYSKDAKDIYCPNDEVDGREIKWNCKPMLNNTRLDAVIETLRKGLKTADRVVIDIEKVNKIEENKKNANANTTKDGIRIPIGIHGANEVQYLTLGVGGSHHALIAGVAGAGKSSLLHTIILRTLMQYSPDELVIYLVDFKRGVEFKIYADYVLPSFKVVSIESEREFGYNILLALEREQKIRADIFRRNRVDRIEEYRELGKKMPRVLVIIDEFHELFAGSNNSFSAKSAEIMERIVRQGRAFGVHMILASQSYSNIRGVDKAVFDQMAARIVLKCSTADANMLLDNGSAEIDQISIDDPGRAVYNSEAGNKEYNSHFRVAYIEPGKHRGMLQEISDSTKQYVDEKQPTRILLSNIEDNNDSIFNRFTTIDPESYLTPNRLYIGEPLSITSNMMLDFSRTEHSNLLMIGENTDKARDMFAFSVLSLCINYKIMHKRAPEKPFIYLLNCKPSEDSYFKDTLELLADMLPEYINYISCGDSGKIMDVVTELYDNVNAGTCGADCDKYLFVFGYQRAEELKSETRLSQSEDIFNISLSAVSTPQLSMKEMFRMIVRNGSQNGVHTVIWHDSFTVFDQDQDNRDIMSYFAMKIAFDMSIAEEYSRFVGANDANMMSENNAIYYNRTRDNQKFRPYQSPNEDWLRDISNKLK